MVILISGTTRTGKTLMAQTLMGKHNIPYMSVDHLKMGLYRGLGDEKYNPEQKYTVLGETLWPVIKGIILTAVENDQNLIIEGCYILPHMIKDLNYPPMNWQDSRSIDLPWSKLTQATSAVPTVLFLPDRRNSPSVRIFILAFLSLSWCEQHTGHSHSLTLSSLASLI